MKISANGLLFYFITTYGFADAYRTKITTCEIIRNLIYGLGMMALAILFGTIAVVLTLELPVSIIMYLTHDVEHFIGFTDLRTSTNESVMLILSVIAYGASTYVLIHVNVFVPMIEYLQRENIKRQHQKIINDANRTEPDTRITTIVREHISGLKYKICPIVKIDHENGVD